MCKYFLSFCRLSFHFVYGFLYYAKVLSLIRFLLFIFVSISIFVAINLANGLKNMAVLYVKERSVFTELWKTYWRKNMVIRHLCRREGHLTHLFWIPALGGDVITHDARWCQWVILEHWSWIYEHAMALDPSLELTGREGLRQKPRLWPAQWPDPSQMNQ